MSVIRTFIAAASLAILAGCNTGHDTPSSEGIVSLPVNTSLAELSFAAELRSAGSEAERRRVEAKINRLDRELRSLNNRHEKELQELHDRHDEEIDATIFAANPEHGSQAQVQSPLQPNATANATIKPLAD